MMKTKSGIQGLRGFAPAVGAALLSAALPLLFASPAAAALQSFFADSGGPTSAGAQGRHAGVLNFGREPSCTTDAVLPSRTGRKSSLPSIRQVFTTRQSVGEFAGNELYLDLEADNPGEVTIQLGYGASVTSSSRSARSP